MQDTDVQRIERRLDKIEASITDLTLSNTRLTEQVKHDSASLREAVKSHGYELFGTEMREGLIVDVAGLKRSERRRVWRDRAILTGLITVICGLLLRWIA